MTQVLRDWIVSLASTAVVCGGAMVLTPQGRVKKVLQLVCGLVMVLALVSPLMTLDLGSLSRSMARYREMEDELTNQAQESEERLNRSIIERECAAYIWDKAAGMDISLSAVTVTARWDEEGFWYPWQVTITGSEESRSALGPVIEAGLGIPEERQYWSSDEDN